MLMMIIRDIQFYLKEIELWINVCLIAQAQHETYSSPPSSAVPHSKTAEISDLQAMVRCLSYIAIAQHTRHTHRHLLQLFFIQRQP